ncbi:hypothetical protein [Embleya sp. NPDC001921]
MVVWVAAADAGAAGGGEGGAGVGGARARRGRGAWETAFTAAVVYREREGYPDVPRAHVETVTVTANDAGERASGFGGAAAVLVGGAGTGPGPADGGPDAGIRADERVEVRLGKWVNNQRPRGDR